MTENSSNHDLETAILPFATAAFTRAYAGEVFMRKTSQDDFTHADLQWHDLVKNFPHFKDGLTAFRSVLTRVRGVRGAGKEHLAQFVADEYAAISDPLAGQLLGDVLIARSGGSTDVLAILEIERNLLADELTLTDDIRGEHIARVILTGELRVEPVGVLEDLVSDQVAEDEIQDVGRVNGFNVYEDSQSRELNTVFDISSFLKTGSDYERIDEIGLRAFAVIANGIGSFAGMSLADYQKYLDTILGYHYPVDRKLLKDIRLAGVTEKGQGNLIIFPTQAMLDKFHVKRKEKSN